MMNTAEFDLTKDKAQAEKIKRAEARALARSEADYTTFPSAQGADPFRNVEVDVQKEETQLKKDFVDLQYWNKTDVNAQEIDDLMKDYQ